MHAPNHPHDRACQLVAQDDTDLWLFTMLLKQVCVVNLDLGIDWPVNPQIKLTRARLHLPAASCQEFGNKLSKMCGIAQHSLANAMLVVGYVQLVPARCPTRQYLGPIYPN